MILHTDGVVDLYNLEAFVGGYQSVAHLTMGELWATPAMIRLALVENLAELSQEMLAIRRQFNAADMWAERILSSAETVSDVPGAVVNVPQELLQELPQEVEAGRPARAQTLLTPTFIAQFSQRLREGGTAVSPVLRWLEGSEARLGINPEEAIRVEFSRHAAIQVSVANTITSMRTVAATDWAAFVERHSFTEVLLRTDPAGIYPQMDFATRDRYRHVVERISRRSDTPEEAVATWALRSASQAQSKEPGDLRYSHVGYYLVGQGVYGLRTAVGYKSRLGESLSRIIRSRPTAVYVGSIAMCTLVIMAVSYLFIREEESRLGLFWVLVALGLTLLPASEFAVRLVDQLVTLLLSPRVLPKLDLSNGIPPQYRTFVAIPTLIKTAADVDALARHVELLYLANQDPNLRFAVLSDFADAPTEELPGDAVLLQLAVAAIEGLNTRYSQPDRFYLFHRKRQWNPREGQTGKGAWMGWERKRGKLADFNALLLGEGGDSFTTRVGDLSALPGTRYVITLDSDTDLPTGTAHRLIGTLAHALNRAALSPKTGLVIEGYGILQPLVSTTWKSAGKSLFSRVFSGHTGIDPYTSAVSSVYQDLFREGSFIGKGIYDVEAFSRSTAGRFPTNTVLSHDLLEGAFARAGFASDIGVYEDFPARYNVYAAREHRWVRGDWQILEWLLSYVPTASGHTRNTLSLYSLWKIFDNLRRSLVAPASVALLALAWTVLPGVGLFWTLGVLATLAFPVYANLLTSIFRKPVATPWARHIAAVLTTAGVNLVYFALGVVFIAYRAYNMGYAIVLTLLRMYATHRHLLEWVTAREAQQRLGSSPRAFWRRMWFSPALAILLAACIILLKPQALITAALFLVVWAIAPSIAYYVSKPVVRKVYVPTERDISYLRTIAYRSWRYFVDFVGPDDLWLAPDNYQEEPKRALAHRTSPTNLGLTLLSTLSAYDLGFLTLTGCLARLESTLASMEKLDRYNGHFYNWYDTLTGAPLPPRYISTVDSGNLAAHLLTLKQGCVQLPRQPVLSTSTLLGLRDAVRTISAEIGSTSEREPTEAGQRIFAPLLEQLDAIDGQLESVPATTGKWAGLVKSLQPQIEALAGLVRQVGPAQSTSGPSQPGGALQPQQSQQPASNIEALSSWVELLAQSVREVDSEIGALFAWAALLESPHPLLVSEAQPEIETEWRALAALQKPELSLAGNLQCCFHLTSEISRLQRRIQKANLGEEGAAAIRWLGDLRAAVAALWTATDQLLKRIAELAGQAGKLTAEMKFGFLFDPGQKLFSIGYNVSELKLDASFYDLLASEARLASYVAIARGEVPQEHWFRLSRPVTGTGSNLTLFSWTGTMFEYLMPNLVMPVFDGTLLAQTCSGAVRHQAHYGASRGVPWGMSEAAYNSLDADLNYQYRAFGVPDLGLKRGLAEDLVVAPYATVLALPVDPKSALSNLRRLAGLGMQGRYGFYDSADFTPARLAPGQRFAVVSTFMVHHTGMSLLAINNYLNDNAMVRRFASEPALEAIELLLQERIPLEAPTVQPHPVESERQRMLQIGGMPTVRSYNSPYSGVPSAHLLSNGRYSVMVTNSGAGYSRWDKLAVTRWRDDALSHIWGTFVYMRDKQSGLTWSATAAPIGGEPAEYHASFDLGSADFRRRDGAIETHLEVLVSPEDDAEIRRVTLTNRDSRRHDIELTSYAEVVLATQSADEDAPVFNKLFVETEYIAERGVLLAHRRPRSPDESQAWLMHVLSVERDSAETTGVLGSPVPDEYETDRALFLARGHTPASPQALGDEPLQNSAGAVLDPIVSLRQHLRLRPNTRATVSFVTAIASSREEALSLADKYHDPVWAARAAMLCMTHAGLELRQMGISTDEAVQFQRLFSRMIYPSRGTSPSRETLSRNVKGQQGLWAYGISGDLPILLVRIADPLEARLVRQALRAHEYWQCKGFEADLVVLNEYPGGYIQPIQDELEKLVATSHARDMVNKPGGVYVRRADIMPDADCVLLRSVARVVLVGSRGSLGDQLDREVPEPPLPPAYIARSRPQAMLLKPRGPQLSILKPQSSYSEDGREYVIRLDKGVWTPLPWSNVIANQHFGCIVTESSLDVTWAENSRENRLTPWSNDPVSDRPSEAIYIRDEESGQFWTPTPLPVREDEPYTVRHGQGYTIYEHSSHGIEQSLRVFVPPDDPVKVCALTLVNKSERTRRLSLTYYTEWVLGVLREAMAHYVVTEADLEAGAILVYNRYNADFAGRVAFAAVSGRVSTLTADRVEFLGRDGSVSNPAALKRRGLSGRAGAGFDPCAALQTVVELQPGEERQVIFALGQGENADQARTLAAKYRDPSQVEAEYKGASAMWDWLLAAVEVHTPDKAMDLVLNRWLLYQTISCRYWGRSAFYQGGGAYGFRDQLQDVMALVYNAPVIAREHILRCCEHQFKEGDVQHWWHPPTGKGVRTRFSDDMLWLPFVTAYYIEATGDTTILDERRPFLEAPPLDPGQEDRYGTPSVSNEIGTLYEHCLRSIERGSTAGAHGLPLMGSGDWNDGMNRVGIEGKGESVWVGWFLYAVLAAFSPLCEGQGDTERAKAYFDQMGKLKQALNSQAWDPAGSWYMRAFYDDGTPLGSSQSEECKIDAIAQSWSVISGAGDSCKMQKAMQAAGEWLVREQDKMVLLFTPPFDHTPHNPGYIKGYPPGIRENGGQYTHGAIWTAVARAQLRDGDEAYRLFSMLNPGNHTRTAADIARYKVEPYVIVADIYSHPQHVGRGGWTWYTGSASWFYRLGVEYILGLKLRGAYFTVEPCIPSHWSGYSLTYRYEKSLYRITVERDANVSCGLTLIELDGARAADGKIDLVDDAKEHSVRVVINY